MIDKWHRQTFENRAPAFVCIFYFLLNSIHCILNKRDVDREMMALTVKIAMDGSEKNGGEGRGGEGSDRMPEGAGPSRRS